MESLAKMEKLAYQVYRGLQVPKEAREKLGLQVLGFQDHRVSRGKEEYQDFRGPLESKDQSALLALKEKRAPKETWGFQDCRGLLAWE